MKEPSRPEILYLQGPAVVFTLDLPLHSALKIFSGIFRKLYKLLGLSGFG
jgi:hypothetical protein